jgi:hypothetical protein
MYSSSNSIFLILFNMVLDQIGVENYLFTAFPAGARSRGMESTPCLWTGRRDLQVVLA